jgi:hypothetical protein
MFKVTYTAKNKKGYLVDRKKNFEEIKDAYQYMTLLNAKKEAIGQPILEKVS